MTLKENKKQSNLLSKTKPEESLDIGIEFDFQRWLEKKGKKNIYYKYIGFGEISNYK